MQQQTLMGALMGCNLTMKKLLNLCSWPTLVQTIKLSKFIISWPQKLNSIGVGFPLVILEGKEDAMWFLILFILPNLLQ